MRDYPLLRKKVNKMEEATRALSIAALSTLGLGLALSGSAAIIDLVEGSNQSLSEGLKIAGTGLSALYVGGYAATLLSEKAKNIAEEDLAISEYYVW